MLIVLTALCLGLKKSNYLLKIYSTYYEINSHNQSNIIDVIMYVLLQTLCQTSCLESGWGINCQLSCFFLCFFLVASIKRLPAVSVMTDINFPMKGQKGMVDWDRNSEDKVVIPKGIFVPQTAGNVHDATLLKLMILDILCLL